MSTARVSVRAASAVRNTPAAKEGTKGTRRRPHRVIIDGTQRWAARADGAEYVVVPGGARQQPEQPGRVQRGAVAFLDSCRTGTMHPALPTRATVAADDRNRIASQSRAIAFERLLTDHLRVFARYVRNPAPGGALAREETNDVRQSIPGDELGDELPLPTDVTAGREAFGEGREAW